MVTRRKFIAAALVSPVVPLGSVMAQAVKKEEAKQADFLFVQTAKSMSFEMPSTIGRTMQKGSDWDQLTDEAKKAFGDQFGSGALRWSAGSGEKISGAGNGKSGLFVNRGPQPLAMRVPQN